MHWCCCSELIVHTNAGITVKCLDNKICLNYQTCDILLFFNLFFPGVKLPVFGIEPLFELLIFTAVDKVKDRILYNKV